MAKNKRFNRPTMYPLIELFNDCVMTQKQFCDEMDIALHTFNYWLTKYRKENELSTEINPSTPKFQELHVSPSKFSDVSRQMRITYPDGTMVEIPV